MRELQEQTGVAIIFVTHNLGIVARMCDKLAVMYAGKIVEAGSVRQLFNGGRHPYTKALLGSMPKLGSKEKLLAIPGQPPDLATLPPGCAFHPRCPEALPQCASEAAARGADRPVLVGAVLARRTRRTGIADRRCPETTQRTAMPQPLLEIDGLTKHFPVTTALFPRRQIAWVKAVDGIDFAIEPGETVGVIGESGCGKTTTSKLILLQETPTSGAIRFDGQRHRRAGRAGADALPPRGAGRVPGPVQLAVARACGSARSSPSRCRSIPT